MLGDVPQINDVSFEAGRDLDPCFSTHFYGLSSRDQSEVRSGGPAGRAPFVLWRALEHPLTGGKLRLEISRQRDEFIELLDRRPEPMPQMRQIA